MSILRFTRCERLKEKIGAKTLGSYPAWVGTLIFGSIWGFLEATVGAAVRLSLQPFKPQIHMCPCPLMMFLFGFPIMASVLAIYRKPVALLGTGLIAAGLSLLTIPILSVLGVPIFTAPANTYPFINPAVAIALSSVVFGLVAGLARKLTLNTFTLAGMGALSAMFSSIAFIYAVVGIGAPILKALQLSGPLTYVALNGTIFAAMAALTVPIGYMLGVRANLAFGRLVEVKPWLYRVGPTVVAVLCWAGSAVAISAGLYAMV
jgi:hypothetical protein